MNILRILEFDTKYLLILVSQSVVQMAYDIHCEVFSAKTSFTKRMKCFHDAFGMPG